MNLHNVEFLISAANKKDFPANRMPEIAFAGKSNVGKSSVNNRLLQRKNFARVGEKPGKTIHVNYFTIDKKCYFVDLPGYGFAKAAEATRKTWSDLIGGYLAIRENLTGIVVVMDARRPFMPTDEWLIQFLSTRPVRMHFLLNKADQLNNQGKKDVLRLAQARAKQMGPHVSVQLFSGLKREGVDELRDVLLHWINREEIIQQDI